MLSHQQMEAKWIEIRGGMRNLWGGLTNAEIDSAKDNLFALSGIIEERYHESKEEIYNKINRLLESFDNDTDKNLDPDVSSYQRSPLGHQRDYSEDRIARH